MRVQGLWEKVLGFQGLGLTGFGIGRAYIGIRIGLAKCYGP